MGYALDRVVCGDTGVGIHFREFHDVSAVTDIFERSVNWNDVDDGLWERLIFNEDAQAAA